METHIQLRDVLYEGHTGYQAIKIVDTLPFGRTLVLIQTSERDEFLYHEMLVHPALISLAEPRRVLIIGGGDGGCARRVLEHPVEEVVQVELDPQVVELSRQHLPAISAGAYDDPRLRLVIGDGFAYVRDSHETFDAVIIDSTDPLPQGGPSSPLFGQEFYRWVMRLLPADGVAIAQTGSPFFMARDMHRAYRNLASVFPVARLYLTNVPSYSGSLWSFTFASRGLDPLALSKEQVQERLRERGIVSRHYNAEVHFASFLLPPFLSRLLADPGGMDTGGEHYPVAYLPPYR